MSILFKLLVPMVLLATIPHKAPAADRAADHENGGHGQIRHNQGLNPKTELTIAKALSDMFPAQTCWGQTFDIHISGLTGDLESSCHGATHVWISIAVWEEDSGWLNPDDRVEELWIEFETGGLTSSVPYSHTFEDVHLAEECNEWDWVGEFYVEVKGPCLASTLVSPVEDVSLIFTPTAPEVVSPADGAVEQSQPVTLQWNGRTNASFYQVQLDDEETFATTIVDEQTGNLTFDVTGLDVGAVYFWRVSAHNSTCGAGNWSTHREFTTETSPTSVTEVPPPELPRKFALGQNHPNPFNMNTTIEFGLPRACHVTIDIYNISGRKTKTLVDEQLTAGYKVVRWDGTNSEGVAVASGVYFYRIVAGDDLAGRKMILLK
ncbi:MAG: T9SS type A sorting domain-containing protein [candidate division Zixibacteria bacterium]|nr:T9SS type A sorting domain-containing protein [candidate division Zixibacteria bacterium]MDH3937618.1 T9SS type A sorting domain-containing protein [candidate division Zixibacteria bacterium]MDH4032383.1 T9SS type A sorting domain-containing protein [candidate division Zixibacteria bacterium]